MYLLLNDEVDLRALQSLRESLDMCEVSSFDEIDGAYLYFSKGRLACVPQGRGQEVYVDWGGTSPRPLLKKAIGKSVTSILDGTGGLGRDASWFLQQGYEVDVCERELLFCEMLRTSCDVQKESLSYLSNLSLFHMDCLQFLHETKKTYSVIYLDLFFDLQRTAKPKLDLQFLKKYAQKEDSQPEELLNLATEVATQKVVMKRHRLSSSVGRPSYQISGRSLVYDVYVVG